jgi:hypothetical protein
MLCSVFLSKRKEKTAQKTSECVPIRALHATKSLIWLRMQNKLQVGYTSEKRYESLILSHSIINTLQEKHDRQHS